MPDVARVLKEEISRLARKEAQQAVRPLTKQVRDLRNQVREQKQEISGLRKKLPARIDRPAPSESKPEDDGRAVRISPASVKRHRGRLKLTQEQMALLVDVSPLTVSSWETGRAAPQGQNRLAMDQLRKMGIREVRERLEGLTQ